MVPNPVVEPDTSQVRREWALVLAFMGLGAVLRLWKFGALGLTHFDEGVYAAGGAWSLVPGGLDPGLVPYAPPGYPILVGLAYAVLGLSDSTALLVAIACGVATIPAAGWIGRRTFGPGAGAASAAFAALALAHVAFSRKALTDAPFLLAWLGALGLGGRFLERPGPGRAAAFGLAVGLAQNVKYNGWLAGAVVALAALLGAAAEPEGRRRHVLARTFGWGLVAVLVAGLVYAPWFGFVEGHGGYAALMRHHQGYMQGLSAWIRNWTQQLAQVAALSGGWMLGLTAWLAAWCAAGYAACGRGLVARQTPWDGVRFRVGGLIVGAFFAVTPEFGWWAGLAWLPWLARDRRPAVRVLAAWWIVLTVLTPLYHPYARLWLPLHAAGWILTAGAVVALGPFQAEAPEVVGRGVVPRPRVVAQGAAILACLFLARAHWVGLGREPSAFPLSMVLERTDGLRQAVFAAARHAELRADPGAALRVLGRRPIVFYLGLYARTPFQMADSAAAIRAGTGWALVDEAIDPEAAPESARRVAEWDALLDPVTLLDIRPDVVYQPEIRPLPATIVLIRTDPPRAVSP